MPRIGSDEIGLTSDQYDEINHSVGAGYIESQRAFNSQLQQELRQQQFQISLQRDIGRSLSNNSESFAHLPTPRAEFDLPPVNPRAPAPQGSAAVEPNSFYGTLLAGLYATEHKLSYRMGDSYQLVKETADSFTTVHNVSLPHHGETTRTYNVNGELVQYSDKVDSNKNRYFVNDAQGKTLLATTGNFNGKLGNSSIAQALALAILRVPGNQAATKAQYFFSANGQSIGSFGQLQNEDNEFEANFDVNYTPVSEQFPAATPTSQAHRSRQDFTFAR